MSSEAAAADRQQMLRLKTFTALAATLVISGVVVIVWGVTASAAPQSNVAYCHATRSPSKPYVYHETDGNSLIKSGHSHHSRDIIPPFDYDGGHFDGLNWPEGEAILDAHCVVGEQPPATTEPPSTTTPPASDDPTTTTTPPASDDPTTTTTPPASDDPTTTTTPPANDDPTTTTTPPAHDDPSPTTTPPAHDDPTAATGASSVVVESSSATTPPPANGASASVNTDPPALSSVELARTGSSSSTPLAIIGMGLVLLGTVMLAVAKLGRRST